MKFLLTYSIDTTDAFGPELLACLPIVIALALCAFSAIERLV